VEYSKSTESYLINKSKKGDTKAFEELMARSKDYLVSWILRKTRCVTETEEVLQITYIKCWNNIKKFQGKSGFKTWACSISRNLFIDRYRKSQKQREMSIEEVGDAYMYEKVDNNECLKKLIGEEDEEGLNKVLKNLPKIHSDVLFSFAIEELTYKEIAKKLGCSIGTVMSRLYYARKKAKHLVLQSKELKRHHVR
jgi:RNA polymerase sigma-70 factor (ECF subfamily)